uniref:Cytochrome c oxidase subunit 1 n=1 Tax=Kudoa iwatai TaxID=269814 RepID=A0A0H5AY57_9CNID|nr:cytochrome c oxidase subunit I [Kudoa iwatai]
MNLLFFLPSLVYASDAFPFKLISFSKQNTISAKQVAIGYWRIALLSSIIATTCSGFIRIEISFPQVQSSEQTYFSCITAHGILFIFLVIVPIGQGYLNWWFPGQCGKWDFSLPRINIGSMIGTEISLFLIIGSWLPGGWSCGWTMYPPLSSIQEGNSIDMIISGIHLIGVFGGLSSTNTLITFKQIEYNQTYKELSLFIWSQCVTAILFIGTIPSLALALLGILCDRSLSGSWFDPSGGGDPVSYQILFWFFGHPEVYVVILPSFGVISTLLESQSSLYGREGMIASISCLGILGYLVYGHHMFTVDLEMEVKLLFSSGSMAIAIPTGIKVYSWILSIITKKENLKSFSVPIICFIFTFVGGGLTGIMLSSATADILFHDTYFVIAHFHQVMAISSFLAFSCGIQLLGYKSHSGYLILFTIGTLILFFPLYYAGIIGTPRRIPSMTIESQPFMFLGLIGYFLSISGTIGIMIHL